MRLSTYKKTRQLLDHQSVIDRHEYKFKCIRETLKDAKGHSVYDYSIHLIAKDETIYMIYHLLNNINENVGYVSSYITLTPDLTLILY